MKFSTRKDVEAPADYVYDSLTDFDAIERQTLRRGYDVQRKSAGDANFVGMSWKLQVPFRNKQRHLDAKLVKADRPNEIEYHSISDGVTIDSTVELVALSRKRTRVVFGVEIKPSTLKARLFLQSLKLAKSTLDTRFDKAVGHYCDGLSERYETDAKS